MKRRGENIEPRVTVLQGMGHWLLERMSRGRSVPPSLTLVERIALAPRQSLALVEVEGRRLLVATGPEGAPAFYALETRGPRSSHDASSGHSGRIAW